MYYENSSDGGGLTLKNLFVTKSAPRFFTNNIQGRYSSAFMYILCGEYRFSGKGGSVHATAGDTLYLPKNGFYSYEILSTEAFCILANFDLEQDGTHEDIIFSDSPARISRQKGENYKIFNDLAQFYSTDKFICTSLLYQLILICKNFFTTENARINAKRIEPALKYIEENYAGRVSVESLAALCGISTPHFRRLFKEVMGATPIKYKNRLLAKSACHLLVNDGLNVSETAYALNFSDIYTFSQLFKKEMGISPKKYLLSHVKKDKKSPLGTNNEGSSSFAT